MTTTKGIIVTKFPESVKVIQEAFPDWIVFAADIDTDIRYHPAPEAQDKS